MSARIALVIGQLGYGGAEKQLSLLARGLHEAGENLRVICLSGNGDPWGPWLEDAGVPVTGIARRGSYEPLRALRLAAALRRERVDIVHAFLDSAIIYSYLASFYYRKSVLIPSLRSLPVPEAVTKRALLGRAMRGAALVNSNSLAGAAAYAERYRLDRGRIEVVHNCVELAQPVTPAEREQARRRYGLGLTRPVIGTVGKDHPDKNIPAFLRLAVTLGERLGGVCSVLAGRGLDERYAVRNGVSRLNACESFFLGEVSEMRPFYAAIDLLVLPSLREGLPNVLLEAAAHGVPCVAFATGGVGEAVEHETTGLVVPAGDEAALLEAAAGIFADRDKMARMGAAARERAGERFSVERMVASTRGMYGRALNDK
jgi:glycosyltransferase involved in cell wall biosynthesis